MPCAACCTLREISCVAAPCSSTADATVPASVTVLEIVELLDGPLGRDAQGVFADAAASARKVLAETTISDVLERERREAGAGMYHI